MLNGTDTLHLLGMVGIINNTSNNDNSPLIYPNPLAESCFIEFDISTQSITTIKLNDVTGNLMVQVQNLLQAGHQKYSISGLNCGIYTIQIKAKENFYTGKLISRNTGNGSIKLSYISDDLFSAQHGNLKSIESVIPMQYNLGDQLLFTCYSGIYTTLLPLIPLQSSTITANFYQCSDSDSNHYSTVTIGTQVWMAENLNVGSKINGDYFQSNNGIIEKYCYDDDESNCSIYGGLYQWNEMMRYDSTPGIQGICPDGWHLPVDSELTVLQTYLGGNLIAGETMKEACTYNWNGNTINRTDSSGFTARAGGVHDYTGYFELGSGAYFWSSTNLSWDETSGWNIRYNQIWFTHGSYVKRLGFSVRCIMN